MKLLSILLFFFTFKISHSQVTERRFFNAWGESTSKDSSTYYKTWSIEKQRFNAYTYYTANNQLKAYEPRLEGSLHGEATYFHQNGQLHFKIKYTRGKPYGIMETYYPNGKLQKVESYDSLNSGQTKLVAPLLLHYYDSTGNQKVKNGSGELIEYSVKKTGLWLSQGRVKSGLMDSVWLMYYPNGKLFYREEWSQGEFLTGRSFDEAGKEYVYRQLGEVPGPPGGMADFYKHINLKLRYPYEAKRLGIEGRVLVEFIVESDGTLSEIKVIRGISPDCDKEAVQVVGSSPKWKPGIQKGQPVRTKFNLPIIFKIY